MKKKKIIKFIIIIFIVVILLIFGYRVYLFVDINKWYNSYHETLISEDKKIVIENNEKDNNNYYGLDDIGVGYIPNDFKETERKDDFVEYRWNESISSPTISILKEKLRFYDSPIDLNDFKKYGFDVDKYFPDYNYIYHSSELKNVSDIIDYHRENDIVLKYNFFIPLRDLFILDNYVYFEYIEVMSDIYYDYLVDFKYPAYLVYTSESKNNYVNISIYYYKDDIKYEIEVYDLYGERLNNEEAMKIIKSIVVE